ncbi:MAG: FMN-binding protein [Deltaproteobacteria bacterium]|nr:FMN-binding protein [Deltaproteobacteria bacterium]
MGKLIRLALVLGVITCVAGAALAYIHSITLDPIEYAKINQVKAPAVAEVFAEIELDNDPVKDRQKIVVGKDKRGRDVAVYAFPAKKGGAVVAVAIETFGLGYNENLGVMTAIVIDDEGEHEIIAIAITSHSETPGKGDAVEKAGFRDQFKGLSVGEAVASGRIDAISGATMSTNGVIEAVNAAIEIFNQNRSDLTS